MRKVMGLVLVVSSLVGSLSAMAIFDPSWERPIQSASLTELNDSHAFPAYPRAQSLTMNQRDGVSVPTTFTLVEDTGIRCVMAPCPSSHQSQFVITNIQHSRSGITTYTAREIPPAHVRMILRTMTVTDFTHAFAADPLYVWMVKIRDVRGVRDYGGNPEGVITIQ